MALSLDDFLKRLNESGLLTPAEVSGILDQWPADRPRPETQAFAQELVRQKRLTKFQAEQIHAGKGKSLTLGNYLILDKLGQGGMGMVLKARHRRMDRLVALKVMSPAALKSADAVKRFHREVQAAAKLEHPNIVTAYDADEASGTHFLVMQFIDGNDLSELVKKHGPLPVDQAVRCILQAARGLEFAHEQGVIHRDIKPANLLIDAKGTVKILDMGLARIEGAIGGSSEAAGLTNTGAIMGTVDYMPPEQAMDAKHADARSDIYSLGISLYYLLTGHVAYGGDTMMKKLMAHRESPIPSLVADAASVRANASDASSAGNVLDTVFQRMVAKKPEDRFQTMTEVIAGLERCLAGAPTIAIDSSASGSASGNELQQFLRQISGGESPTTISAPPTVAKAKVAASSERDAETITTATSESGADAQSEATMVLEQSGLSRSSIKTVTTSSAKSKKVVLTSVASVIVLLLVIVFALRGKSGTLHLEIKDELIEVTLGETGRVVKGVTEQDLSLSVGEHVLHVKRDDLAFDTDPIALKKGEPVSIKVERVGRRVRAMQGSTLLGHKESAKSKEKTTASPAAPDFALEFALSGRSVEIPLASFDPNQPWTLEGYIQPDDIPDHNQGLPAVFGGDAWRLNLNHWSMRLVEMSAPFGQGVTENVLAETSVQSLRGKRFHVAAVYADKLAQFFINGKLVGGAPSKFLPKQYLGKLNLGVRFQGTLDEWRISKVGRYGKDFTPPQRYEPDADTLALYHFDEGTGDVLKDSSGNNHHGKITDAKWVRADGLPASGDGPASDVGTKPAVADSGLKPSIQKAPLPNAPPDKAQSRVIELLPLVNLQRDSGVGKWTRIADGVACENPAGANVLQLPYEPPEEYDFEIEFTTTGSGLNVNQYVAASGTMFAWKLNSHNVNPPLYGFELLDGKFAKDNKEAAVQIPDAIKDGQRYRSTVEVRRGSLRTLLDGKELVKWTGDFKRLSLETATPMKHPDRIGIGSWRRPVTFHSVTVRVVSGAGKVLASAAASGLGSSPWTNWLGPQLKRGMFQAGGWSREGDAVTTDRAIVGTEVLPAKTRDGAVRVTYLLRGSKGVQLSAREHTTGGKRDFSYFAEENGQFIQIAQTGVGTSVKYLAKQTLPNEISKDAPRTLEFRAVGETLTLTLNDSVVLTVKDAVQSEGLFAMSALKGVLIQKVEVQSLDDSAVNLLSKLDAAAIASNTKASITNGTLQIAGGRLTLPVDSPPAEYDVKLRVERKSAGNALALGLVSGGRPVALVMDGFQSRGGLWGLENIDGKGPTDNGTAVPKTPLPLDQPVDVLVQVRKTGIRVERDGKPLIDWKGLPDKLSLGGTWDDKGPARLFLGAQASFVIHRLEFLPVGPTETGWLDLFNGKDLAGWKSMGFKGWTVENGVLLGKTTAGAGNGWLMSDREFSDFDLELEYKLGPGSNSGIFLRAWPEGNVTGSQFREIQLLDDEAPAFVSIGPERRTGSLFGLVGPQTAPKVPASQWHHVRVHLQGQQLQLTINGVAVLKHTLSDLRPSGRIGLQLYPTQVEFRNIRVRPIGDGRP